ERNHLAPIGPPEIAAPRHASQCRGTAAPSQPQRECACRPGPRRPCKCRKSTGRAWPNAAETLGSTPGYQATAGGRPNKALKLFEIVPGLGAMVGSSSSRLNPEFCLLDRKS